MLRCLKKINCEIFSAQFVIREPPPKIDIVPSRIRRNTVNDLSCGGVDDEEHLAQPGRDQDSNQQHSSHSTTGASSTIPKSATSTVPLSSVAPVVDNIRYLSSASQDGATADENVKIITKAENKGAEKSSHLPHHENKYRYGDRFGITIRVIVF